MTRRATAHDYSRPGTYHITLHVAEGWDSILGTVVGDPMAADGTPEAPRVGLSPVGQMVEHELLTAIHTRYPMVYVQDHIVMPDHLHALVRVTEPLVSASGKSTHLGQVIAGFKKGCNKRYWEIIGNGDGETASHTVTDGSPVGTYKVPSNASSGRPPLFALGYCDVMPVDATQLATQRAYIQGNPRSRLLRLSRRDLLTTQRAAVPTALTPAALTAFLRRECAASQATPEALEALAERLLTRPTRPAGQEIVCDSYGDRALLQRRLLPVVCHRRDKARFAEQKRRCLDEAQDGAVLRLAAYRQGRTGDHRCRRCRRISCGLGGGQRLPRALPPFRRAPRPLCRGASALGEPLALPLPPQGRGHHRGGVQDAELCGSGPLPPG